MEKSLFRPQGSDVSYGMTTMALETVGCRLNQSETERLAAELVNLGFQRVSYKEKADLYILNTCTVTGRADADCRKLINRALRLNKDAVMVVTGCYVVSTPASVAKIDGVDLLVGNDDKMRLPQIIRDNFPHLFSDLSAISGAEPRTGKERRSPNESVFPPNRAMVKIGDGCNQRCSYCIVPLVRGPLLSFPPDGIIGEIRQLIGEGYHEVVLTAVHIGKYHYDGLDLAGLIDRILAETSLSRLRLSSLEPNELDDRLLGCVAFNPRVCRHLHLPMQSGSDRILSLMRRPYRRSDYLAVVEKVKNADADITVGCDLIVGFPGETERDFSETLSLLDSGYIDYGHVFSYSDRPGTEASGLAGKISPAIIKERNYLAREVGERNRCRQMKSQIGKMLDVISEHVPHRNVGYFAVSDNYLRVHLPDSIGGGREILGFKPTRLAGAYLEGDVTS